MILSEVIANPKDTGKTDIVTYLIAFFETSMSCSLDSINNLDKTGKIAIYMKLETPRMKPTIFTAEE